MKINDYHFLHKIRALYETNVISAGGVFSVVVVVVVVVVTQFLR
jgi:hypothetical protein